jgi:hypothetical protein
MAKKLLNEAVVRRFQSLANISPLNEMYKEEKDEEKMEEGMYEAEEDKMEEGSYMEAEEDMKEEMDMDAEAPEMDMDGDLELTDDEADAIIALGKKLEAAMMDDEPEMDMEDEAPMDMEDEEPEEKMEDMLEGISYQPSKSELINEVAKRVAKRLAEAKKAEKRMNEALSRK